VLWRTLKFAAFIDSAPVVVVIVRGVVQSVGVIIFTIFVVIAILIVIVVVKGIIVLSVSIIVGRDIVVNKIVPPPRASTLPKRKFLSLNETIRNAIVNGWETRRSKVEYRYITRRCCSGRRYITWPNKRRHASSWSMRDRFGRRF
jgi:hypothetical protein